VLSRCSRRGWRWQRARSGDAVEALGQHVHQEAPDELVRVKPHRLPAARAANAIVLPAERNRAAVGCNEAAVRDGDAMGVTTSSSPWRRSRL
jgi:hypothetical protein